MQKLEVSLIINDEIISTETANIFSKYLADNFPCDGMYGFELEIPYDLESGTNISVVEKKTNKILSNIKLSSFRDYHLLKNSLFFDLEYYKQQNKDLEGLNIDLLEHFLLYGYKENRNPSLKFDIHEYSNHYPEVFQENINPLVHYLTIGIKKNYKVFSVKKKELKYEMFLDSFNFENDINILKTKTPIDIIIPVYNGYKYLKPLFRSIKKNTTTSYRLLICDDKSTNKKVLPFLKRFKKNNSDIEIVLLKNKTNLGFIETVNKLVKYTQNHFVLLNTDTEVPSLWLERLMYPIFYMENIASTTPFTNSGTICSFPNYLEDNTILENMSLEKVDSYFKKVNFHKTFIEIPTGVGFCMGINKDLVEQIGMFDTIFGKGYGEENDWCQRAIKKGYKNIHVTNLFVYHKHGGSFSNTEKNKLVEKNLKIVNKKHKGFDQRVDQTIREDKLRDLRKILYFKMVFSNKYSTLIFDHNLGGGTQFYIEQKIKQKIDLGEVICLFRYDFNKTEDFIFKFYSQDMEFEFINNSYDEISQILSFFSFDEIFLNSFVSFPNIEYFFKLCKKLKTKKTKMVVPIHDYFPICINYNLLDYTNKYCNIPDDLTFCNKCLKESTGDFKKFKVDYKIESWRKNWNKIFKKSDEILCFSLDSKSTLEKVYPKFNSKIVVQPHDIKGKYENIYDVNLKNASKNIIGILGAINEVKGATIIKDLVSYIKNNDINAKVVLIGYSSIKIEESKYFHCTNKYESKELPFIVKENKITQFLIPSIWPETFSYTTEEIMQLGYPLTVFNLGAPAQRVKDYKYGSVIEIENLYEHLFKNL